MRIFKFRNKGFRSIKTKIAAVYFIIITLLISVIGSALYLSFRDNLLTRVTEDQKSISSKNISNLNLVVNDLNYSLVYLSADKYITKLLNQKGPDMVTSNYYRSEIWDQYFNIICLPGTDINSNGRYYLFLNDQLPLAEWLPVIQSDQSDLQDEKGIYKSDNAERTFWYKQAIQSNGRLSFSIVTDKSGEKQLYITKKIINNNLTVSDWVGVAVIVMPASPAFAAWTMILHALTRSRGTRMILRCIASGGHKITLAPLKILESV